MPIETENLNGLAQIGCPPSSRSSRNSPASDTTPVTAIAAASSSINVFQPRVLCRSMLGVLMSSPLVRSSDPAMDSNAI
jgi:hypothetical protein